MIIRLGYSSDFVTLMTYDQYGDITPSGPAADIRWIDNIVKCALKYIPAEKISAGIPLHSIYWYIGKVPKDTEDLSPDKLRQSNSSYGHGYFIRRNAASA